MNRFRSKAKAYSPDAFEFVGGLFFLASLFMMLCVSTLI